MNDFYTNNLGPLKAGNGFTFAPPTSIVYAMNPKQFLIEVGISNMRIHNNQYTYYDIVFI